MCRSRTFMEKQIIFGLYNSLDLQNVLRRLNHICVSFLSALSGKEKYLCHAVVYWSQFLCLKSDASFAGAFPRNGWWQGCVSKPMWCCSNCFFRFSFLFLFFHFWLGQTVNSLNWRRVSQSHTKDGEDYMSTASTYHPPPLMLFQ